MFINQNKQINHFYFMSLALAQAQRNLGNTKENPSVGCVITKNNCLVSAGYTSINGRPHAERNAIDFSKKNLNNSSLYVTLEPCTHYGKTPPCTKSIVRNKIKRVFFSINDPDLRSYNKSTKLLKNKKIVANKGICESESNSFYRSYIKYKTGLLPFVTCKLALSKDFFTIDKRKKWITNKFSRGRVHLIRSNHDCIITSCKTVIVDNSRLTCRIPGLVTRSPSRIILDKNLRIPLNSRILIEANKYPTIIFFNKFNKKKIKILKKLKIKLFKTPLDINNNLDLYNVLIKSKQLGYNRILLEAGMKLNLSFFQKNLIDDLNLFISNKKLGNNGKCNIKSMLKKILKDKSRKYEMVNLLGDKLITYKIL